LVERINKINLIRKTTIYQIQYQILTILLFLKNNFKNKKALQQKVEGLGMVRLPRQDDFRNFCMRKETEILTRKLKEIVIIQV